MEIVSSTQIVQNLIERIEFLLNAEVQSCWLGQAPLRIGPLVSGSMDGTTVSSGTFRNPVLDIEVSVVDIFDPDE